MRLSMSELVAVRTNKLFPLVICGSTLKLEIQRTSSQVTLQRQSEHKSVSHILGKLPVHQHGPHAVCLEFGV